MSKLDLKFMRDTLNLAKKGVGLTSPNPMVGAIIVKDGYIIGKGYHKKAGEVHAEINALRDAKEGVKGAKLYVNLEPCNHFGKTPPCTQEIINSGIKEVVIAMVDPNPLVSGRGIHELKSSRIKIKVGILEEEAKRLNEAYIYSITHHLPFVQLKIAESLDGKIYYPALKETRHITGEESRKEVHKLRSQVDAIIIGKNTALIDNPLLTTRLVKGKNPIRIVLDSKGSLSPNLNLFKNKEAQTIVATTELADKKAISALERGGVEVITISPKDEKVDLGQLLIKLFKKGMINLLVEGGSSLSFSFLKAELVNKIVFYLSPVIAGHGLSLFKSQESLLLRLKEVKYKRLGDDLRVIGYLK
ncbi:bifunctional diaminohydroxyphosphoribosylaminopyrimidine deaminase/5-amino-6-(5-phosphoribosylamino)uracil reductase RibD [bacterium]|nr:bifunctional diaminohydroxyphosphoribosylaminopyrimidine deaminase/5-amino-6-(5-phosphoribosylamino)uracil reductase RibD [bacterium]MBU0900216.1 bifunctional diaminohydroxyphosphoribosylaminopyrimidine deaminase/5-amino-6-(5-phosphoribosylamino)uracil reductase RibD [bacterium]MBU1153714.1 bifunctional diaminohydroxyphosphoribosylaminopyrimidine deaminase/5-amino-6-(5-phosphoribosylamino)uracil reductase RibD [bacterium]MBU1782900.1 bifunctional diaminohydroxyphosphoribosylaminopyrimidine de